MLAQKMIEREQRFDTDGRDSSSRQHVGRDNVITVPGSNEEMPFVRLRPKDGNDSFYYKEAQKKTQIVLHLTMGYLHGDVAMLTRPGYHVSVPFLIGRTGKIYNLFPSRDWSYHLGSGALGGNKIQSQKSIGIELCNIGPLIKHSEGQWMVTSYSKPGHADRYCEVNQKEYYTKQKYRGFQYFATLTDPQYKSLAVLLRYLTARYDIPYEFLPEPQRYETHDRVIDYKGIVSHVNYRSEGKVDIGPAFGWNKIL